MLVPELIGKRVKVIRQKDRAVKGPLYVLGRLNSASDSSIEIVTEDGKTHAFTREQVRELRVRIPWRRRWNLPSVWRKTLINAGAWGVLYGLALYSVPFWTRDFRP